MTTNHTIEPWYGVYNNAGEMMASFAKEAEATSWAEAAAFDMSEPPFHVHRVERSVLSSAKSRFPQLALVDADQLAALRAEERRLRARVDELLGRNTELVEELRSTRAIVARLEASRQEHCDAVDRWAERALSAEKNDRRRDVRAFHERFGQMIATVPFIPDDATVKLRLRLVAEEVFELLRASLAESFDHYIARAEAHVDRAIEWCDVKVNMAEFADATIDIDYVVEGTRRSFGLDGDRLWPLVHAANMLKTPGPKRDDGKILKGDGWQPPDIAGELRRQGWSGP